MAILRFNTEEEMLAIPNAHYWVDGGNELPWVALTEEDKPVDTTPIFIITRRQFFLALYDLNLYNEVMSYKTTLDQKTQIEFDSATTFSSDYAPIVYASQALGMSNNDLLNLFIYGSTL